METVKDWRGNEIAEPERASKVKVWEIEPTRLCGYSSCLVMGWQDMLEEASETVESLLENLDGDDEMKEGVTIKVRLIDITYDDYLIAIEDD